ncbi:uncharacterized protein BJX67DRAFT_298798 [Aspergillus lucknowensis]|uniref:Uncharacterized protein n=1 Tax=Aspergillus lucknowensis TaxID=176173 RepID=A0ABR4LCX1_9EURO
MAPIRRVINAQWVTDILQYALDQDRSSIILIVCTTRDSFLKQLLATVRLQSTETTSHHHLLTKSLGLLSRSHAIKTVFCPTLEHLRAYLSAGLQYQAPVTYQQRKLRSLLAIVNPLSLHHPTREFSAQGLSRTLANAVEASYRADMDIVLCECQDALSLESAEHGEALWNVDVPLLSDSIRLETEASSWTGQAVPVKRVVQRWFQFEDETRQIKRRYPDS